MSDHHSVLVIGGGAAGLTVAASLRNAPERPQVTLVEPSEKHYYQPLWTLVGGGVFPREESERDEADFVPDGVTWIKDRVASFDPANNAVVLQSGRTLTYDWLVVTMGIQLDWHKIDGLAGNVGKNGLCSNYSYDTVSYTWEAIKAFKGGKAIFTFPNTPIKCAGAPQKIMWLAEHWFEKQGIRSKCSVVFNTATPGIFGVPRYARTLSRLARERGVDVRTKRELIAVRADKKEAVFRDLDSGAESVEAYDLMHVTPPQSAPDVIKKSPLANAGGWVDVHKHTTQHVAFPNVFSIGDCSSLPNSKTAAAIRKQAPVLVENLLAAMAGRPLTASYNGYASCPLVTGYGRLILAEFGYDGVIMETLPVDQSQERYSMWVVKTHMLPRMYWHGMLRGRW
jgi:sulfide:quinone oxidoreductase